MARLRLYLCAWRESSKGQRSSTPKPHRLRVGSSQWYKKKEKKLLKIETTQAPSRIRREKTSKSVLIYVLLSALFLPKNVQTIVVPGTVDSYNSYKNRFHFTDAVEKPRKLPEIHEPHFESHCYG